MLSAINKKKLASHDRTIKLPYLIKITHYKPSGTSYYFFANSSESITYNGDIYNSAVFSIQPPERDGSKIGNATLTICVIDQQWIERIRETQIPAKLEFIAVIVGEGIEPLEENSFTLRNASWNEISITWEMIFDENMAIIVPSDRCNAMTTPGCA